MDTTGGFADGHHGRGQLGGIIKRIAGRVGAEQRGLVVCAAADRELVGDTVFEIFRRTGVAGSGGCPDLMPAAVIFPVIDHVPGHTGYLVPGHLNAAA